MQTKLIIPRVDDFHVHLRQGDMMEKVVPLTRHGGVGRCVVMPNTDPPVRSAEEAVAYRTALEQQEPELHFLMTLYLHAGLSAQMLQDAVAAGIVGVKCYPQGVTTHSQWGVADLRTFDPLFATMESLGLCLLLHGEVPTQPEADICILNAEEHFLPEVERLHAQFPALRIVLEHVTTREAVVCVRSLGPTVGATITAHHLDLIADDWAGRTHNFCKPVAKYPHDREALRDIVREGHPRFFLGSDSAPHPRTAKEGACGCAGVFTAPLLLPYLADTFERMGCIDKLQDFCCTFGHRFYGLPAPRGEVVLARKPQAVPAAYDGVVPFRAGQNLAWTVQQA